MWELAERLGMPTFIQLIIEMWNCTFLMVIVFSVFRDNRLRRSDTSHRDIVMPFGNEIIVYFFIILFYNLFDVLFYVSQGDPSTPGIIFSRVSELLYNLISCTIMLFEMHIVKKYMLQKIGSVRLSRAVTVIQAMQVAAIGLLAVTPFTGAVYYFDENNNYHLGPVFYVGCAFTIIALVFTIAVCIVFRKKTNDFVRRIMFCSSVITLLGMVIKFFFDEVNFNNITASVIAMGIFIYVQKTRVRLAAENARKIDRMHARLMLSQIKPHFIYNSLAVIRSLCYEDPEKAVEVLDEFSVYLERAMRLNLDDSLIPLREEMEFVDNYLFLEEYGARRRINVIKRISSDQCLVPPLSVQPIVENSLKHAFTIGQEDCTVIIEAYEKDGSFVVSVEDNGRGFEPDKLPAADSGHIGINNIRERIGNSGGTVLIESSKDSGTRVTLTVPKHMADESESEDVRGSGRRADELIPAEKGAAI